MAEEKAVFGIPLHAPVARYAVFVEDRLDLCTEIDLFLPASRKKQEERGNADTGADY